MEAALFIGFGISVMVLLGLLVVLISSNHKRHILKVENQNQLELFKTSVEAEELQKTKIAQNLHDQIIPQIAFSLNSIQSLLSDLSDKKSVGSIRKEVEALKNVSVEIRDIAHDLTPSRLKSYGLLKTMELQVKRLNTDKYSSASFHNLSDVETITGLSETEQLTVYRIFLEVINNLYKHAKYQHLGVFLENVSDVFTLRFSHDGIKLTNNDIDLFRASTPGMGLNSIQWRLMILKGRLDYSFDTEAAYVTLQIPVNA